MNITSPIFAGAVRVAEMPGDSRTEILKVIGPTTGLFDDNPDGGLGMVMSVLAGVAASLAVAILFSIYLRTGHRSARDIVRHGLAAVLALGLIAFVISDMRHAALAYLGLNPMKPAIEFEIRLPRTELTDITDTQIELRTDHNQKLAKLQDALDQTADGRSVLRGTVTLDYRTSDRMVVVNLPGQAPRQFKLRLPASPTHSDRFSPWHLSDGVTDNNGPNDAFAIRYRVL